MKEKRERQEERGKRCEGDMEKSIGGRGEEETGIEERGKKER